MKWHLILKDFCIEVMFKLTGVFLVCHSPGGIKKRTYIDLEVESKKTNLIKFYIL